MKRDDKIQGRMLQLLRWPIYILPVLMIVTAAVFVINLFAGIVVTVFDLLYLIFAIWWTVSWRRQTEEELVDFAMSFQEKQRDQIQNLPTPYAVLGHEGELLWSNQAMEELIPETEEEGEEFAQTLPALSGALPQDGGRKTEHIHWNGRAYEAEIQMVSEDADMYSLFLFDETEHLEALTRLEEQKTVVGLIYIDNYEEAMSSAEAVRQSLLAALIERKISKYFANYDGIVRKTEKDKFFLFMRKKGLIDVQEDRFSILEDVKTLNIGNNIAVTLSISIGTEGASMEQNNELCRTAIDLALGRGGDQAVVKTPGQIKYYGGKTQQHEKNTRVKARVKAQALRELMLTKDQILIMGHKIPDVDAFGAAVGIFRAARTLDKRAHIVIDEVSSSLRPMVKRFQDHSEYPSDMIISSEKALAKRDANTIVVVVDVNRPSYTECPALLDRASTVVVLDHHRQGNETIQKATLSYIESYASSASEMVAEILQYFDDSLRLRPIEAETIYAGIVVDTNNFTNKAGVRTFEAAAFLRRHGADVTNVRKLFRESPEDIRARARTVSAAEMFEESYALSVCSGGDLESPTIIGAQAANEMLNIVGVKASIVLTEFNGTIYVSARSIDEVNVQLIMERLGGGGHLSIAGAQLKGCTVEEAKQRVKDTILQMKQEGIL
ncbi:MAG: DHH family phosphoesterase [Lachnospiraceae bacterium]|nr:DHH family phosphoesterase [Lachnospiraceae bacterium]